MSNNHQLSRRSFVAHVIGGASAVGAFGVVFGTQSTQAQSSITDEDKGRHADQLGRGRGNPGNVLGTGISDADEGRSADQTARAKPSTGVTDSDSGQVADLANFGTGGCGADGVTDSDPDDPAGCGSGYDAPGP